MSRRPLAPTTGRTTVVRAPSSTNLHNNMGPPAARLKPQALVASTSSNKTQDEPKVAGSRSGSPSRGKENKRVISNGSTSGISGKGTRTGVEKGDRGGDDSGEMNIQVVVRCRGRSEMEASQRTPNIVTMGGQVSNSVCIETGPLAGSSTSSASALGLPVSTSSSAIPFSERAPISKTYQFDKVFGPGADQTLVFKEVVENVLDEVISGYNCTIFAYGQTGTGKTYTMQGDLSLTPLGTPVADAGIIPRVLHRLFAILDAQPNSEYSVKCSYIELYNEELRDLLANDFHAPIGSAQPMAMMAGKEDRPGLKIYEDQNKKGGVMIQGLEEAGVRNAKEGLALLKKGSERRQTAETNMNAHSSRSHSIMTLTVHIKETSIHGGEDLLKVGKLNLVDLAGSEAIGRSGAQDKRAREAGMINQSLLTLGRVITALVEKNSHIPYRESKLTRMLQDSLGGRTKTCIVATISPTKSNMEETLSTLDYAIRASTIRNKPEINQRMTKGSLIKEYVNQIERLKHELLAAHEKNGGYYMTSERKQEIDEEMDEMKANLADAVSKTDAIQRKHDTMTAEFEQNMQVLLATEKDLQEAREAGAELKVQLDSAKVELEAMRVELEEEKYVSEAYRKGEERIGKIAENLKKTVNESVADVGGLFAKIARKADVLDANSEITNAYGQQLTTLSSQLRKDIGTLQKVQSGFGKTLQSELEAFAKRGAETLEQDKLFLDHQLDLFGGSMSVFQKDLVAANEQTLEACGTASTANTELKDTLLSWMSRTRAEAQRMVESMAERQRAQAVRVDDSISHVADMLDLVVDGALEHTAHEMRTALDLKAQAVSAADTQTQLLRQQNERLSAMLKAEQENSAKLRDNLVSQISTLLTGFTTAQDQSLQKAVGVVQAENTSGVTASEEFAETYSAGADLGVKRSEHYKSDLGTVRQAADDYRAESKQATEEDVAESLKALHGFEAGFETSVETASEEISRQSLIMADSMASASSAVHTAAASNSQSILVLEGQVKETYGAAKERLAVAKEDIKLVSSAVLSAHASAEPMFAEHVQKAQNRLQGIQQSGSAFISSLKEDMATGSTPRKRVWNVPDKWSSTKPRATLIDTYRHSRLGGSQVLAIENDEVLSVEIGTLESGGSPSAAAGEMLSPSAPATPAEDSFEVKEEESAESVAEEDAPIGFQSRLQAPTATAKPGLSRSNTQETLESGSVPPSSIPARKVKRNA